MSRLRSKRTGRYASSRAPRPRRSAATGSRALAYAALAAVALAVAGCAAVPVADAPAGFAEFSDTEEPTALSPEGVGFRVRAVENEPEQTLEFWSEALERHLVESGYVLRDRRGFSSPAGDGVAFEWIAPVGDADWTYLTAIVVADEAILLAEAAGPVELYETHRPALETALTTIDARRANGGSGRAPSMRGSP